ncbi:MAG: hypothetical protein AAGA18_07010 [Verrucomicrobiota bacterium]
MQVNRIEGGIEIILFRGEATLLQDIFSRILSNYSIPPDELSDAVQKVWYPKNIQKEDREDSDDLADVIRDDFQIYRSENSLKLKSWISLLRADQQIITWRVEDGEIDRVLTILNDHRLYRAAELGVGQDEMDRDLEEIEDDQLRGGILEIHFLAWLIELVLRGGDKGVD